MTREQIWAYLYGNRVAISAFLSLVVSAAVKTAPEPGEPFGFYEWGYDFFHQMLNITDTRVPRVPRVPKPTPEKSQ